MIEINHVTKAFDDVTAVDDLSITIRDKSVFGLIGTNGAGKSTLIRMISGIYKCDFGNIQIENEDVFENEAVKQNIFLIPEEQYFMSNYTPLLLGKYYATQYPNFAMDRYLKLLDDFGLDKGKKIRSFSKGMKKQVQMLLGLSANTKYLICDETFDGLDPVMRFAVKSLIANDMVERGLTCIISSHNLRELEDVCDYIGLLHKGGILLSEELDNLKFNLHKVQCVLQEDDTLESIETTEGIKIIHKEARGRLLTLTLEGNEELVNKAFEEKNCVFYEIIPLTLEEIFISKTKEVGYDVKSINF